MKNEWDAFANEWDNDETQLYSERVFSSLQDKTSTWIPALTRCQVLDFGCGTGLLTEKLARHCAHVLAIDTSEAMIDVLRGKIRDQKITNIDTLVASIDSASETTTPQLSRKFDLITCSSVCGFLPDYPSTLQALSSLLKPSGLFTQWDWLNDMPIDRIQSAFAEAGLASLSIGESFHMSTKKGSMAVVLAVGRRSQRDRNSTPKVC